MEQIKVNSSQLDTYKKIWRVVQAIPSGKVSSYGAIADIAGLPGRARLVGKCLGQVPKDGFCGRPVPWFRVLRSDGSIAFPIGSEAFDRQKALLMDEGVFVKGRRINLNDFSWRPDLSELFALEQPY